MDREQILSFARRDWRSVALAKAEFWSEEKRRTTPEELYRRVHGFREQLRTLHPGWPSDADRAADLAAHLELSRRLGSVGERSGS